MEKQGISCRRCFWIHTFSSVASTQPCRETPVEGDYGRRTRLLALGTRVARNIACHTACGSHCNTIGSPLVRLPRCMVFLAGWTCIVSRLMSSVCYRDSELYIELSVQIHQYSTNPGIKNSCQWRRASVQEECHSRKLLHSLYPLPVEIRPRDHQCRNPSL